MFVSLAADRRVGRGSSSKEESGQLSPLKKLIGKLKILPPSMMRSIGLTGEGSSDNGLELETSSRQVVQESNCKERAISRLYLDTIELSCTLSFS